MAKYIVFWATKRKAGVRTINESSELHAKQRFITYYRNKGKVPRTARIWKIIKRQKNETI